MRDGQRRGFAQRPVSHATPAWWTVLDGRSAIRPAVDSDVGLLGGLIDLLLCRHVCRCAARLC